MRAALLGLLLSFAAGIANAADTPQSVVGIWYGRGQPVDEREDFIDHFRADGSFVSFFRKYEKCELQWQFSQTGHWRLEGLTLITNVKTAAGKPVARMERYGVEFTAPRELHVRHIETNYLFRMRRQENYRFPLCEPGV